MPDCNFLYEALRNEVNLHKDDILNDMNLILNLTLNYPRLVLSREVIGAIGTAIKNEFVDLIHSNYDWNGTLLREFDNFADTHNINREVMLYIGESFAYALELIDKVEHKKAPKFASSTKKLKRLLTVEEINKMVESIPPSCDTLYLHTCDVEMVDKQIRVSGYISGKFSSSFRGGVFGVSYYDSSNNYISGWYRTSIFTVPYTKCDSMVRGKISILLDPIYNTDSVKKIHIYFYNSIIYSSDEFKSIDINWCN